MKVTNLRKKLASALLAGGMLAPSAVWGANLNTNLVTNSGFENINAANSSGGYGAVQILDWNEGSKTGFAYSHNGASGVPDYANGGLYTTGIPFDGGGNYYFTSNASVPDVQAAGEVSQLIDVSAGDTATAIDAGRGEYDLSAIFNTFSSQNDWGNLRLDFLDGSNASLGNTEITPGANVQTWTPLTAQGDIPIGTASLRVSLYAGGGNDGYIDNVSVIVLQGDAPLGLDVDLATGSAVLANPNSVNPIEFDFYEISSPSGSLLASWNSLEDQGLDAIGTGTGQHWTEGAGVGPRILTEAFLLGTSQLAAGASFSLPNTLNKLSIEHDLVFRYGLASEGVLHQGVVSYSGTAPTFDPGDFDADGDIDSDDWNTLRSNQHTDLSGLSMLEAYVRGDMDGDFANNHADFVAFKAAFESIHGMGSFEAMVRNVPEPNGYTIVWLSIVTYSTQRERRSKVLNQSR